MSKKIQFLILVLIIIVIVIIAVIGRGKIQQGTAVSLIETDQTSTTRDTALGDLEVREVRDFFDAFVAAESAYSLDVLDFYAPDAQIIVTSRNLVLGIDQYKMIAEQAFAIARDTGETYTHENIEIEAHQDMAMVTTARTNSLTEETSQYQLRIQRFEDGNLYIVEEKG